MIPIALPPLRERPDDIPALVRALLGAASRAHGAAARRRGRDDALALLRGYRWPGNVRELANIVERLAILHKLRGGPVTILTNLPFVLISLCFHDSFTISLHLVVTNRGRRDAK